MDNGLISGLAQGLQAGIQSYQTQKKTNEDLAMNRNKLALQAKAAGYDLDENGNIVPNKITQLEQQNNEASYDPNSDYSKSARQATRTQLGLIKPGYDKMVTDDMSAKDLEKRGLINVGGAMIKGTYGDEQALLRAQAMSPFRQANLDFKRDNQASQAGSLFDKDPNLQTLTTQQQKIRTGKHTLESVPTLTPQLFNEIQLDIANAISGGRSSAVSTQNKTEFNSLETEYANLKQRLSNRPQDIQSPEVKKYVGDILERLDDAYQGNMEARAKQIAQGRNYQYNPAAQQTIQSKVQQYARQPKTAAPGGAQQGLLNKVKVSNGKQTLLIDPSDIDNARGDGFEVVK